MGTRGLFGMYSKGKTKANYNHYDSYPSGLGVDLLTELKTALKKQSIDKLRQRFNDIVLVKESEGKPSQELINKYEKYGNPGVGGLSTNTEIESWYQLLRNVQGTLEPYFNNDVQHMIDGQDFIIDSLFCEYAYIINLDEELFEVYEGFQKSLHTQGRYAKDEPKEGYYPCKLIISYSFNNLPSNKKFIKDIDKITEENV